jgi:hypothetical protein
VRRLSAEIGALSISLNNLQLSIFSPTGSLLFNSGFFEPIDFADVVTGASNAGFVFALDDVQARGPRPQRLATGLPRTSSA